MVEPPRASERSSASSIASRSSLESMPRWLQNRPSSATITARGSAGAIALDRHPGPLDPRAGHPAPQHQGRDRVDEAIERRQQIGQQQDRDHEQRSPPDPADRMGGCGERSSWQAAKIGTGHRRPVEHYIEDKAGVPCKRASRQHPLVRMARAPYAPVVRDRVWADRVFVLVPGRCAPRVLIGWDIGVLFYLARPRDDVALPPSPISAALRREQDEGAFALLLLTVAAGDGEPRRDLRRAWRPSAASQPGLVRSRWRSSPWCCPGPSSTPSSPCTTPTSSTARASTRTA